MSQALPTVDCPHVLTITGTDPVAGAGVMADIKTIAALGGYGLATITAVVAQNTLSVRSIGVLDPHFVKDQIDMVFEDVRVDAVKIGMVGNAQIANIIVERLKYYKVSNIVLDPVMVASSGDALLASEAISVLRDFLVPVATLITPNLPEAGVLLGVKPARSLEEMRAQLTTLYGLGPKFVLLKGGHMDDAALSIDLLYGGNGETLYSAPRLKTSNGRGTGCTLSAAIATLLLRHDMTEAVRLAKAYVQDALLASDQLDVGQGPGPLHHFHAFAQPR